MNSIAIKRLLLATGFMLSGLAAAPSFAACKVGYVSAQADSTEGPIVSLISWRFTRFKSPEERRAIENQALDIFAKTGNLADIDCGAPIHAAAGGYARLMEKFIDAKVDLYAGKPYTEGLTPLMVASMEGQLDIVALLIDRKAALVDEKTPFRFEFPPLYGVTSLQWAAMSGHAHIVKYLLEHGAMVNYEGPRGRTALNWARRRGNEKVVAILVQHGGR